MAGTDIRQFVPDIPTISDPEGTQVKVSWEKYEGATGYKLVYRQFPEPWESAITLVFDSDTTEAVITELLPTSTYQFKISILKDDQESQFSEIGSGDTLTADCSGKGDKKRKNRCVIQ